MTTTTPSSAQVGTDERTTGGSPGAFSPEPGATRVEVGLGRRVMVVSDLLLTPEATPSTPGRHRRAGPRPRHLGRSRHSHRGGQPLRPHRLVRFPHGPGGAGPQGPSGARAGTDPVPRRRRTTSHPPDRSPRTGLCRRPRCRWPPWRRGASSSSAPSTSTCAPPPACEWSGVEPGEHAYAAGCSGSETEFDPAADAKPGIVGPTPAGRSWRSLAAQSTDEAPWLVGLTRLSDPSALSRFVVSRTLYRRLGRYAWWLLVPFVVAGLLRVAVTPWVIGHLGSGLPARAIRHAHQADLGDQIVIASSVALVVLAVLALVLGLLSRRMWSILGGGALDEVRSEAAANDNARVAGRRLVSRGYAGLITAATFQSELTHLGVGFYANVGATAEVVEEHRGRLGLPPVFLHNQRVSWVELETGAELHVRMLMASSDLRPPSMLERAVTQGRSTGSLHPSLVASYPMGDSWPPAPDLHQAHRRTSPRTTVGGRRHPLCRGRGPARRHHPASTQPAARGDGDRPTGSQCGRRRAHRHGRPGPGCHGPGHPPGPATGLEGGGRPPGGHHRPPPHRRGRYRGIAGRPGRPGGSLSPTAGTSRPHRTGRRCARHWWPSGSVR